MHICIQIIFFKHMPEITMNQIQISNIFILLSSRMGGKVGLTVKLWLSFRSIYVIGWAQRSSLLRVLGVEKPWPRSSSWCSSLSPTSEGPIVSAKWYCLIKLLTCVCSYCVNQSYQVEFTHVTG